MLRFFTRRPSTTIDVGDPLAIRNLLDNPALRALVFDTGGATDASAPVADRERSRRRRFDPVRTRHLPRPRRLSRCLR